MYIIIYVYMHYIQVMVGWDKEKPIDFWHTSTLPDDFMTGPAFQKQLQMDLS